MGEQDTQEPKAPKRMTRRTFLKLAASAGAGALLRSSVRVWPTVKVENQELVHGKGVFASAEQLLGPGYTRKEPEGYTTTSQLTQGEYPNLIRAAGTETLSTSSVNNSAIETRTTAEVLESADGKKKLLAFKVENNSPAVKVSRVFVAMKFGNDLSESILGSSRLYQEDLKAIEGEKDVEKWITETGGEFFVPLRWQPTKPEEGLVPPVENFNNIARVVTEEAFPVSTNVNVHLTEKGAYLGTAVFGVEKAKINP